MKLSCKIFIALIIVLQKFLEIIANCINFWLGLIFIVIKPAITLYKSPSQLDQIINGVYKKQKSLKNIMKNYQRSESRQNNSYRLFFIHAQQLIWKRILTPFYLHSLNYFYLLSY